MRRSGQRATALALAAALGWLATAGCGVYGPPRRPDPKPQEASAPAEAETSDDEPTEPEG